MHVCLAYDLCLTCLSVCLYFTDARERERLERHASLSEACSAGDAARVRQLLRQLGRDAATVINMTPDGCSTLLYKSVATPARQTDQTQETWGDKFKS